MRMRAENQGWYFVKRPFGDSTLTAAINSIAHLHVKGIVKTKMNAMNKWNAVSHLLLIIY